MKKIIILGLALCSMISCKKYDDSELWDAVNKLQADTVKENNSSTVVAIEKGAIKAAFSIAEGKQVYFSMGNLQYKASENVWRFAPNQWEVIGDDNTNIASDYDGWIDMFGFGTSGWDNGVTSYQPYSTSTKNSDYYVNGVPANDLTGNFSNADWGIYNKIVNGGNETGLWRTLSNEEWRFLLFNREGASEKRGIANVNGVNGLILLPDNWIVPEGLFFNSGLEKEESRTLFSTHNCFNLIQWSMMEKAGAIFLPAESARRGTKVPVVNNDNAKNAYYWTSSVGTTNENATYLYFSSQYLYTTNYDTRAIGINVRLVQDVK